MFMLLYLVWCLDKLNDLKVFKKGYYIYFGLMIEFDEILLVYVVIIFWFKIVNFLYIYSLKK